MLTNPSKKKSNDSDENLEDQHKNIIEWLKSSKVAIETMKKLSKYGKTSLGLEKIKLDKDEKNKLKRQGFRNSIYKYTKEQISSKILLLYRAKYAWYFTTVNGSETINYEIIENSEWNLINAVEKQDKSKVILKSHHKLIIKWFKSSILAEEPTIDLSKEEKKELKRHGLKKAMFSNLYQCPYSEKSSFVILFYRTNHSWYFVKENKNEINLKTITNLPWNLINTSEPIKEIISHSEVELEHHHELIIFWLKLSEFMYISAENDINTENEYGYYPFLLAVLNNNIEKIKRLIKYAREKEIELSINKKNTDDGYFPLLWAVHNNNYEILELLIEYAKEASIDINMNLKDNKGIYPLLLAVQNNNKEIVEALIKYSIETENELYINEKDNEGTYPLLWTVKNNNTEIRKLIIDYSYRMNIIMNIKCISNYKIILNIDEKETFKNTIKSMIKEDYEYEILTEGFYEWNIYEWGQPNYFISPNFRIGKYIWRIELIKNNDDELYSIYLRNMDSFEFIYVNYVFYILNPKDYSNFKSIATDKLKFYNKINNIFGISSYSINISELFEKSKSLILGIYIRLYNKNKNGSLTHLSPEHQYKKMVKLGIHEDSQYEILTENFYEWKIHWKEFNNSLIYSPHFKIGGYIWRIELDNRKNIKIFLRNMNKFEYIYANFAFSFYNNINYSDNNITKTKNITKVSPNLKYYSNKNDKFGFNLFINKGGLKEKLLIKDNDVVSVVLCLRIYKNKNNFM